MENMAIIQEKGALFSFLLFILVHWCLQQSSLFFGIILIQIYNIQDIEIEQRRHGTMNKLVQSSVEYNLNHKIDTNQKTK